MQNFNFTGLKMMPLIFQNAAIWESIAPFLANPNAQNSIDFKMNIINLLIADHLLNAIDNKKLSALILIDPSKPLIVSVLQFY